MIEYTIKIKEARNGYILELEWTTSKRGCGMEYFIAKDKPALLLMVDKFISEKVEERVK